MTSQPGRTKRWTFQSLTPTNRRIGITGKERFTKVQIIILLWYGLKLSFISHTVIVFQGVDGG